MYSCGDGQLKTVFEIDVGQIDRGASMQWISQYPHEDEFLMPPLSNLEVVSEPRVEEYSSKGQILVVKLRLNVNFKSKTLDELVASRQRLHVVTMENLMLDTDRLLVPGSDGLRNFRELLNFERDKDAAWFNNDANFRKAQEDMMDMKTGTLMQDTLCRYAQRILSGKRVNEIQDFEHNALLKQEIQILY